MDVGPTRSMGFTPNAIERTTPNALPAPNDSRPKADGAVSATDPASTSDRVPPAASDAPSPRAAEVKPEAPQGDKPPLTDAERNMQRLMKKVAGPLRTYIEDGPLSDDDKKALVEALTQFDADVGSLSETVDVKRLNKEMRAAFEQFYVSLIRIFGARDEQGSEAAPHLANDAASRPDDEQAEPPSAWKAALSGDERRPFPADLSFLDAERSTEEADRLSVESPPRAEQGDSAVDEAYQRVASMYTALYGLSGDQPISFLNEHG